MTNPKRIHYTESDMIPPVNDQDDELWWMSHYWCDCGWESHDSHDDLPDDGRSLAEEHAAATGHVLEADR